MQTRATLATNYYGTAGERYAGHVRKLVDKQGALGKGLEAGVLEAGS